MAYNPIEAGRMEGWERYTAEQEAGAWAKPEDQEAAKVRAIAEATALSGLGVIDGRTMVPAGLVDPSADHPWWAEIVSRLERGHALDNPTWAVLERVTLDNPFFGVVAGHLMKMERT